MEASSLTDLMQLAERAEVIASRLQKLVVPDADVHIPDVPLPLSLQATEKWLKVVDECYREPRLARSRQLLESHDIDTAAIPSSILDHPESIATLVDKVEVFPESLRLAAFASIGRALTKSFDDADSVLQTFSAANEALGSIPNIDSRRWIYDLAMNEISEDPGDANSIAGVATTVSLACGIAENTGVHVPAFYSLSDANDALTHFTTLLNETNKLFAADGFPTHEPIINGLDVTSARLRLQQEQQGLRDEKLKLMQRSEELLAELKAIGISCEDTASTVSALKEHVPHLEVLLEERRRELRESLGADVFEVVHSFSAGSLPTTERVSDAALGHALRKAIECGYRVQLEPPHEDQ